MTDYTPGPWRSDFGWIKPVGVDDDAVAEIYEYTGSPEQQANARLIAAAPDLLQALERILPYIAGTTTTTQNEWCADVARAAIAQARGQEVAR